MKRDPSAESPGDLPFDPDAFERLFEAEDAHFWFCSRNAVIRTVVRQLVRGLPTGYRALEIGCGTGNVLRVLRDTCVGGRVDNSARTANVNALKSSPLEPPFDDDADQMDDGLTKVRRLSERPAITKVA